MPGRLRLPLGDHRHHSAAPSPPSASFSGSAVTAASKAIRAVKPPPGAANLRQTRAANVSPREPIGQRAHRSPRIERDSQTGVMGFNVRIECGTCVGNHWVSLFFLVGHLRRATTKPHRPSSSVMWPAFSKASHGPSWFRTRRAPSSPLAATPMPTPPRDRHMARIGRNLVSCDGEHGLGQ